MKDYYRILEIELGTDIPGVKKAYRKLALKYHPDVNKATDAALKFIEITEAYEVLRDPTQKSIYDSLYKDHFAGQAERVDLSKWRFEEKGQEWARYGRKKAEEYSSIPYEEFARRLLKEISVGVGYIPNLFAMLLTGGMAVGMLFLLPSLAEDVGGGAVFFMLLFILGLAYATYRLYIVANSDYKEDRKRKILNQNLK